MNMHAHVCEYMCIYVHVCVCDWDVKFINNEVNGKKSECGSVCLVSTREGEAEGSLGFIGQQPKETKLIVF